MNTIYILNILNFILEDIIDTITVDIITTIKLTEYTPISGYKPSKIVPTWLVPTKSHGKPPNRIDRMISIKTHMEAAIRGKCILERLLFLLMKNPIGIKKILIYIMKTRVIIIENRKCSPP